MRNHFTEEFRKSQRLSETFQQRFWYRVKKTSGCWIWTGGRSNYVYGKMSRGSASDGELASHVASWLIHRGHVPEGMFVCHKCDNGVCVNPDHLFLGTHEDNMKDMMDKGRSCKGEKNGTSILNAGSVIKIRAIHANGGCTQRKLAVMFGVNFRTINYIVHRKLWNHI